MGVETAPESVGAGEKFLLVDRFHQQYDCFLDDLVFQRGDAELALLAVFLVDVHPFHWLRLVALVLEALVQVFQVFFQIALVVSPGDPIYAGRCVSAQLPEGFS